MRPPHFVWGWPVLWWMMIPTLVPDDVCMHACMYVCMYACIHAWMHACMHSCMHVRVHMHLCMCMYVHHEHQCGSQCPPTSELCDQTDSAAKGAAGSSPVTPRCAILLLLKFWERFAIWRGHDWLEGVQNIWCEACHSTTRCCLVWCREWHCEECVWHVWCQECNSNFMICVQPVFAFRSVILRCMINMFEPRSICGVFWTNDLMLWFQHICLVYVCVASSCVLAACTIKGLLSRCDVHTCDGRVESHGMSSTWLILGMWCYVALMGCLILEVWLYNMCLGRLKHFLLF